MSTDRKEVAAKCLIALGSAYRGDWSQVDGRQTRNELAKVAALLRGEDDFTLAEYLLRVGIVETEFGYSWE